VDEGNYNDPNQSDPSDGNIGIGDACSGLADLDNLGVSSVAAGTIESGSAGSTAPVQSTAAQATTSPFTISINGDSSVGFAPAAFKIAVGGDPGDWASAMQAHALLLRSKGRHVLNGFRRRGRRGEW
jgi:hypothetical protein